MSGPFPTTANCSGVPELGAQESLVRVVAKNAPAVVPLLPRYIQLTHRPCLEESYLTNPQKPPDSLLKVTFALINHVSWK